MTSSVHLISDTAHSHAQHQTESLECQQLPYYSISFVWQMERCINVSMLLHHFNGSFLIKSTICTYPHYKGFVSSVRPSLFWSWIKRTSSFVDLRFRVSNLHCATLCIHWKVWIWFLLCTRFAIESGLIIHCSRNKTVCPRSNQHDTCPKKYENGFESTNIFIDLHHQRVLLLYIWSYFTMWA